MPDTLATVIAATDAPQLSAAERAGCTAGLQGCEQRRTIQQRDRKASKRRAGRKPVASTQMLLAAPPRWRCSSVLLFSQPLRPNLSLCNRCSMSQVDEASYPAVLYTSSMTAQRPVQPGAPGCSATLKMALPAADCAESDDELQSGMACCLSLTVHICVIASKGAAMPPQLACTSTACVAGCAMATAGVAAPAAAAGARGANVRSAKPRSMQNWNSLSGPLSCPALRSLYSCMGCGGLSSQTHDTTIFAGWRDVARGRADARQLEAGPGEWGIGGPAWETSSLRLLQHKRRWSSALPSCGLPGLLPATSSLRLPSPAPRPPAPPQRPAPVLLGRLAERRA